MRPDSELRKLAGDLVQNQVFMSDQIRKQDLQLLPNIFLPLALMDKESMDELVKEKPEVFYAYYKDRIGSQAINGYPFFGTVSYLTFEEYKKVYEYEGQIRKAMGEVTGESIREKEVSEDRGGAPGVRDLSSPTEEPQEEGSGTGEG